MIRITLDEATRDALQRLRRSERLPKDRDRIEMVTLSDAGWSAPKIAEHRGYHAQTVRDLLRAFLARGTAALYPFRSGSAPDTERFDQVATALRELVRQPRTWNSRQLSRALAEQGIELCPRQVRRDLKRRGPDAAVPRRPCSTSRTRPSSSGPVGSSITWSPGPPSAG